MQVSPVDLNACGTCNYQSLINILHSNKPSVFGGTKGGATADTHLSTRLIGTINTLNQNAYVPRDKVTSDPVFVNLWLQYPNEIIRKMAMNIVHRHDSEDIKMEKIQRWVVDNIEYMSDEEQYGYAELWVPPVMLLATQKGDCEDGAFLIMSLGLNAGVDPANLRMFGGFGAQCESAYNEVWPFEDGAEQRILLYRLYHEINHLILFGNSYYQNCISTMKKIT